MQSSCRFFSPWGVVHKAFSLILEHTDGLLTDFGEGLWDVTSEAVAVQA